MPQSHQIAEVALLTHGLGGHPGRNAALASELESAGFGVRSMGFRGHGTDQGASLKADVAVLIGDHLRERRELLKRYPRRGLFLYGHSLGGLVAIASTLIAPQGVLAVAVSAPPLYAAKRLPVPVGEWMVRLGKLLPNLSLPPLNEGDISKSSDVLAERHSDPLMQRGRIPLQTAASVAVQAKRILVNAHSLTVPTLIIHGEDDNISPIDGSIEFEQRAGPLVQLKRVPKGAHELLGDPAEGDLRHAVVEWYQTHS